MKQYKNNFILISMVFICKYLEFYNACIFFFIGEHLLFKKNKFGNMIGSNIMKKYESMSENGIF
jgi:hypothetical protein